ncbi:HD domain-containing protein [Methylibium petroleiphilum]
MTWMLTSSGQAVDLRFMASETIKIEDIAHHLARIDRYTGACRRPYSVAEHSLLVTELLDRRFPHLSSPSILLAALMHDAHEAYTNDLSSPMKQLIGEAWAREERRIQSAVLKRFHLITAWAAAHELVRWADLTALATERRALLPPDGPAWAVETTHQAEDVDFDARATFTWEDWRQAFLDRFAELQFDRESQAEQLGAPSP